MSETPDPGFFRAILLDRLVAEQHNGGGWKTPPRIWNAELSTASMTFNDDDVIRARRRKEALAEWEAAHADEETG